MKFRNLTLRKILETVILTITILFFCFWIIFFILADRARPCAAEARKLLYCLEYLKFNFTSVPKISDITYVPLRYHSPLYFILPSIFCMCIGKFSYWICVSFNLFYYILIALGTFLLSLELTKNYLLGILSILLVSTTHYYFLNFSHLFVMEFGLCAAVCISMFLLLKTKGFTNYFYTICYAISLVLGMLLKWTFIIYVFVSLLVFVIFYIINLNNKKADNKIKLSFYKNFLVMIFLSSLLFFITFKLFGDFNNIIEAYRQHLSKEYEIRSFKEYFPLLFNHYILEIFLIKFINLKNIVSFIFMTIFLLCSIFFVKNSKKAGLLFITWFFMPLFIFPLIVGVGDESMKYIIPILPAQAIIISAGLAYFKKN